MEFGKRHDTTDTTDFCPRQLVTDFLRGNWCKGFWPKARMFLSGQSAELTLSHKNIGDSTWTSHRREIQLSHAGLDSQLLR